MVVSKEITLIKPEDEFRICPACGYNRGFQQSFIRGDPGSSTYLIILICPGCGARFDIGLYTTLLH
jgi:hypothetical protein